MRKRYGLLGLSFVFMVLSALIMQSCEEVSESVSPNDIKSSYSDARVGWGIMEWQGDVADPCKEVCLVAGQHMYVGTVEVTLLGEDLLVTYKITEEGVYLEEVHLDIFTSIEQLKEMKDESSREEPVRLATAAA